MKYLFVVPDGAADHPVDSLGGRTPLEAAATPHMDRVAREGRTGLARTIPEGMPAGSDVGHLSLLGYDPRRYFTGGRAPIEAAALGITLGPEDVAFRLNLVTLEGGRMIDYSAGHIATDAARPIVEAIAREVVRAGWSFHPGVEYRHIFRRDGWGRGRALPRTTPPHDITGQEAAPHLPSGEGADELLEVMERSKAIVPRFGTRATQAWIWSGGRAPALPTVAARFGVERGASTSSVDIVRGLAALAGLRVIPVPGQTALWDTDYAAEGRAAASALASGEADFVYVHVEAPDEATHAGLRDEKVRAIERIDADIVGPCLAALERSGEPFRVLVCPDHATTLASKTHAPDPVPWALCGEGIAPSGAAGYSETTGAAAGALVEGHALLGMLLAR
jgi:2,3-bisphosphoglycerate-independent phosphoglycerate mutase